MQKTNQQGRVTLEVEMLFVPKINIVRPHPSSIQFHKPEPKPSGLISDGGQKSQDAKGDSVQFCTNVNYCELVYQITGRPALR